MKNQLVLLSLVVLFVSLSSVVFAQPPLRAVQSGETSQAASTGETVKDDFARAAADAKRDAEFATSSGTWFAFGFFCGGIGVISAVLSSPGADPGRLVGKSPGYVETYVRLYRSIAKERRVKSSVVGCLTQSAITTFAIIAAR